MFRIHRLAAATALASILATAAIPAAAADLRAHGPAAAQAYDRDANRAEHGRHHRHRGGGIDGGDVLAGVLILGGIAAVAGAIENNERDDDYRSYPPPPPPPQDRYEYRSGAEGDSGSGLDRAADICVDAIERTSDPVGSVDSVRRGGSGWNVAGTLRDGTPFTCQIGNDGQIHDVSVDRAYSGAAYGGNEPAYGEPSYDDEPGYDGTGEDDRPYYDEQSSAADGQYDDDTYARLRAQHDGQGG